MGDLTRAAKHLSIEQIKEKMKASKDPRQLQRWQIIYTALLQPRKAEEIARDLGVSKSLVQKIISRYNKLGAPSIEVKHCGGRYNEYITREEEENFLLPFFERADQGEFITAKAIHIAYEEKVASSVHETTIYRLLKRHGWRKVAPRPRHPQADKQVQEVFKKIWVPPSKKYKKIGNQMIKGQ